jgi:hypothetical protein
LFLELERRGRIETLNHNIMIRADPETAAAEALTQDAAAALGRMLLAEKCIRVVDTGHGFGQGRTIRRLIMLVIKPKPESEEDILANMTYDEHGPAAP